MTSEISTLQLERHLCGDLSPQEESRLRAALATDAQLRERLRALEDSNREILATRPPAAFARDVQARAAFDDRAESVSPGALRVPAWAAAAVAVVLGLATMTRDSPTVESPINPTMQPGDRTKGALPELLLFRRSETGEPSRLTSGDLAHEGDVIQIAYRAAGQRFGVLLSVDGRGVVTRHLPTTGEEAAPLSASGSIPLRNAYRLDAAPRFERFYFVTSATPFAVEPVVEAATRAAGDGLTRERLPLEGRVQSSFLLRK
jgi:hypothetical protein